MIRIMAGVCALLVAVAGSALGGCAGATFSIIEENDVLNVSDNSDKHYTQGLRANWLFPTEMAPALARRGAEAATVANATTEAIGLFVGQEMYTPVNLRARRLLRRDRPYAGWLYAGMVVANVERKEDGPVGDNLDSYEAQIGIVGPESYAASVQKRVHEVIDSQRPRGWRNQLRDEPGLVVSYEHRRRLFHSGDDEGLAVDGIGGVGASLGNVFTHGQASFTLRVGPGLPRDFGVNTIHRSAAEVGPPQDDLTGLRWYLFASGEGRAVARNIFLDGNTWRDSHDVDKESGVAEGAVGFAVQWDNLQLTLSQNVRSKEFDGQENTQRFGSLTLRYHFDF